MKVGKYFDLAEFTVSQEAVRKGLDNSPSAEVVSNIQALCKFVLDPLREKLDRPIVVSSGYRSPEVNKAVGGSKTSQHVKGEAADIIIPGCTNDLIIAVIQQLNLPVDQVIEEFGSWVHISFRLNGRREFLRARKVGKKTVYTKY